MENKWKLSHGCWNRTITSRDAGNPKYFDSEQEAKEYLNRAKEFYKSIGYEIWFANLTSPKGIKTILR